MTHIKLNRDIKIDGVDFEAGTYSVDEIDSGRHSSIVNAGWGELCGAPKSKSKSKVQTDDDDDLDQVDEESVAETTETSKPSEASKPARSKTSKTARPKRN